MSGDSSVQRDERTTAVEKEGTQWAYAFLTYALLLDGVYRSLFRHEAAFDLLALVVAGGAIIWIHMARRKALPQGWLRVTAVVAIIAGVLAAIVAALLVMAGRT